MWMGMGMGMGWDRIGCGRREDAGQRKAVLGLPGKYWDDDVRGREPRKERRKRGGVGGGKE